MLNWLNTLSPLKLHKVKIMFENLKRKIKLAGFWLLAKALIFVHDTRGTMKFDIMGIVLMMVAIWAGTFIGNMVAGMVGFAGGLVGAIIIGFVIYLVWSLIKGQKIDITNGVLFSVLVYLAQMIQNMLSRYIGFGGSLIGLFFTALILSFLVGLVLGPKEAPVAMGPSKGKGKRKGFSL